MLRQDRETRMRCFFLLAAATVLLGSITGPVKTQAYEVSAPGLDDILRGDFPTGLKKLESAARSGDARAAFLLFGIHYRGFSVPRDDRKAISWLKRDSGRSWLKRGSGRPISESLFVLALGYKKGIGVPKDPKRAIDLFKKAAEKGHSGAQYFLGTSYYEGKGQKRNKNQGIFWLERSAKSGSSYAFYKLAKYYQNGKTKDSKDKYLTYLRAAAVSGLASAQSDLHLLYYNGRRVLQDYKKAFYWGLVAAGQGMSAAQNNVGYMYGAGKATKKTPRMAVRWYRMAAEQGHSIAMYNMGLMYDSGSGVKKNRILAHKWFNLAASRGYQNAIAKRDRVERKLSPKAVDLAQRLARQWKVKRRLKDLRLISSGTGFFVNLSHWVVTNQHVVEECVRVAIQYNDRIWGDVTIIGARKDVDLALLRVNVAKGVQFSHGIAPIAPPGDSPLGESVIVFGYPLTTVLSASGVLTTGFLNAHAGAGNDKRFIQISAPIQSGNSGSAVYDEKGRVIGVVRSTLAIWRGKIAQNINFAVKGSVLRKIIDSFHAPNYAFDDKTAPDLSVKERAALAKRNSARVLCYGHKKE